MQLCAWKKIAICFQWQLRQGFDLCRDPVLEDLTGTLGLLRAIALMLRIRDDGLATLAIPCNSFGYMASSQHCRSQSCPLGNIFHAWVHMGNMICLRACILVSIGLVRSVHYFIENPERSSLVVHPYIQFLQHMSGIFGSHRSFWWDKGEKFNLYKQLVFFWWDNRHKSKKQLFPIWQLFELFVFGILQQRPVHLFMIQ